MHGPIDSSVVVYFTDAGRQRNDSREGWRWNAYLSSETSGPIIFRRNSRYLPTILSLKRNRLRREPRVSRPERNRWIEWTGRIRRIGPPSQWNMSLYSQTQTSLSSCAVFALVSSLALGTDRRRDVRHIGCIGSIAQSCSQFAVALLCDKVFSEGLESVSSPSLGGSSFLFLPRFYFASCRYATASRRKKGIQVLRPRVMNSKDQVARRW